MTYQTGSLQDTYHVYQRSTHKYWHLIMVASEGDMHWHAASYLRVVSSYAGGELCSLIGNLVPTKHIMIVTDSVSGITISDDADIIVVCVGQQSVSSQMVAEGGLKLTVLVLLD